MVLCEAPRSGRDVMDVVKIRRYFILFGASIGCLTIHAVVALWLIGNSSILPTFVWGYISAGLSFSLLGRFVSPWKGPILIPLNLLYAVGWLELWRINPYFAAKQGLWLLFASIVAVLFTMKLRHIRSLESHRYLLLCCGLTLLASALWVGTEVNGAKLWLRYGPFSLQPIELVKILLVIIGASFWRRFSLWLTLSPRHDSNRLPKRGMVVLILGWALGLGILVAQRDLGMALLLIGVLFTLFYVAMGRRNLVILGVTSFFAASALAVTFFAHVRIRVRAWWDPFGYRDTDGYQMVQGLYAMADGGPWGRGLFMGRPYLVPEVHNDFIFVAITQELGWMCSLVVIGCCAHLGHHFFSLARTAHGSFRVLLLAGLASLWCIQCFIILGGVTKAIPMTGLTLPFVSYGGSAMLSNVLLVALIAKAGNHGS